MRGRRLGYVLVGLVFALGVVVGGGVALALTQESHAAGIREGKSFQHYKLRALSRRLELDDDQAARVSAILEDDGEVSQALGRDLVQRCGERLRQHKVQVDDEIRTVLRPDQKRRFERLADERRTRVRLGL